MLLLSLLLLPLIYSLFFFFFTDTATTEIYTLSLHDALPIYIMRGGKSLSLAHLLDRGCLRSEAARDGYKQPRPPSVRDRKSTRLNSSHSQISYAVFCLKKKKKKQKDNKSKTKNNKNTQNEIQ